jgi:hypothetical protein
MHDNGCSDILHPWLAILSYYVIDHQVADPTDVFQKSNIAPQFYIVWNILFKKENQVTHFDDAPALLEIKIQRDILLPCWKLKFDHPFHFFL